MTRAREIREERFPLFFFLPSRVFFPSRVSPLACFITPRVFRQLSTSSGSNYNHTACSVVSAFNERHVHSRGTENGRCFEFQITTHRECHRRSQCWAPCSFERRPLVKEKHAWNLFLSDEGSTSTLETLDFTIYTGSTPIRIYLR